MIFSPEICRPREMSNGRRSQWRGKEQDLAEAGGVDGLSVGAVAVVQVVDVECTAWNAHALRDLVVLLQPACNHPQR